MNVKISRTRFEDLCFDLYKAATGVIKKALADAGLATDNVDMVLLAGGKLTSSHARRRHGAVMLLCCSVSLELRPSYRRYALKVLGISVGLFLHFCFGSAATVRTNLKFMLDHLVVL